MPKRTFIVNNLQEAIDLDGKRKLHLTGHSKMRIDARNIPLEYIIETFRNPDVIMPNVDYENAHNYVKNFGDKKVKIGVKDEDEPFVVITAFMQ